MAVFDGVTPAIVGAAQAGDSAFKIERSLRFNSGDSAYLNRTPSSAGNRRTWTWSAWVKLCSTSTDRSRLFGACGANTGAPYNFATDIGFNNNKISFANSANDIYLTDAVLRDYSAWYHIVVALDTTDATTANRVKIYVNGVLQDKTYQGHGGAAEPSQNLEYAINSTDPHNLGATPDTSGTAISFLDGYLADVYFIDGQALAPTDFGEYDDNNVWQPKEYSGTYGTNGFHLDFSDNSSNAALGYDAAGSNDWTVNNLVATAGGSVAVNSITFTGNSNAGNQMRAFYIGSTVVTSSVYATATNNISQYDSGQNSGFFPNATDGNEATNLDWKFGSIAYTFTGQSGAYVEFIGFINSGGSVTINGTTYNAPFTQSGTSAGGRAIYRINLAPSDSDIDSLIDTPTNYEAASGNNGGNYCTLNPLDNATTLSNGSLTITGSGTAFKGVRSTIGMSSGKWYMECTMTAYSSSTSSAPGIWNGDDTDLNTGGGSYGNAYLFVTDYASNYRIYVNKGASNPYSEAGSISAGDIIGIALDLDSGECYVHINGTYLNSGSSVYSTWPADTYYFGGYEYTSGNQLDFNFGQRQFAYTPPTGYKSLCTTNLTDPTIADGSTAMDVVTYAGNASTQTISGLGFSPDFIWIKERTDTGGVSHYLGDTVRGVNKDLQSNTTQAEGTDNIYGYISAATSDGFTVTAGSNDSFYTNGSPETYVAWTWDAGSSTVSNTDGSITSSVRANASAGFSIVSYTGNGTNGATVGHGLSGVENGMIIVKNRSSSLGPWWAVFHASLTTGKVLGLNSTQGEFDETYLTRGIIESVTSSTYSCTAGSAGNQTANGNGDTHIAYCFAPVEGYSAFGSYTGNGSTDGAFVYTGFRPRWIMYKPSNRSGTDWVMWDTKRNLYNITSNYLLANTSNAEGSVGVLDILSNGFKLRVTSTGNNGSGDEIVYAAFAEHPFKTARAR